MANEQVVNVRVDMDPVNELVKIQSRGQFDIKAHELALPFATIEMIYYNLLMVRLQKAGMIPGGVVPATPPSPVPDGSQHTPYILTGKV